MSKNENKINSEYIKFLDDMFSGLGGSEGFPLEDVKKELAEDGIDLSPILKRLKNRVNHYSQSAKVKRLDVARENRLRATSECHSIANSVSSWTRERITQEIERIANQLGPELGVSYRDLNEITIEDLRSLLLDLQLALPPDNEDKK